MSLCLKAGSRLIHLISHCATQVIDILDGMTKKLSTPYVIFYPAVSRDGMPFPINKYVREDIQGERPGFFQEARAWRGNLVVAKYCDQNFSGMMNATMADFPLVKNWLLQHHQR